MFIESAIGNTQLIKLKNITPKTSAEVWVKLEGSNPGGSIKDRTALYMILDAEKKGFLTPGSGQTIVEPTSGNTGIGLATIGASRGYKVVLVMPLGLSAERLNTLKALGAEIVFTDPMRRMIAAREKAMEIALARGAFFPDQFDNPANIQAHYETTGPEIYQQMKGSIDAFVYGSGTGGTIMGVGRYLRERIPNIEIIACEPGLSPVLSGGEMGQHKFQGMGPGFIPPNLDPSIISKIKLVWEETAFPFARRLAREEGLFLGMSASAMVWAAVEMANELGAGKKIVTIAPDSGAKYLSTKLFADECIDCPDAAF